MSSNRLNPGPIAGAMTLALVAYVGAYYCLVQRHFETMSAQTQYVYLDGPPHAVFLPAIRVYERVTGNEVDVNPLIHELEP